MEPLSILLADTGVIGLMVLAAFSDLAERRRKEAARASSGQLQHELTSTEDRMAAGRRHHNGNVRALNTRVRALPSNLVASTFGFRLRAFVELRDPALAQPPSVGL